MSENQENQMEQTLEVGTEVIGKVIKLEDKQVIVDIGAKFDGIIPISELSHIHVEHPNEVLSESEEVQLLVTKLEDEAIVLSRKQLTQNKHGKTYRKSLIPIKFLKQQLWMLLMEV